MKKILLSVIFPALFAAHSLGQDRSLADSSFHNKISGVEAANDMRLLMNAMKEAQPALYRYASPRQVRREFEKGLKICRDSVDYLKLVKQIARLISVTGCSHSGWGHSDAYYVYRESKANFFPFDIKVIKGEYFISRNYSDNPKVKIGSRIVSINNLSVNDISSELAKVLTHDGNNDTHIQREIETYFMYVYSAFIDNPNSWNLNLISPDEGKEIDINVRAQTLEAIQRLKNQSDSLSTGNRLPLQFSFNDKLDTGIYSIESFNKNDIQEQGQDYAAFTDSVFDELQRRNARNLIIDLRNNGGGETVYAKYLFSHFIDKQYPFFESVRVIKTRNYSFKNFITYGPEYNDTMTFAKTRDGLLSWTNNPNLHVYPRTKNRFRGKIYVLINGNTMSAAAALATELRLRTSAVFLGEETGGAMGGPNGMPVSFQLPASKIRITLSTAMYTMGGNHLNKTRGVIPDVALETSISDQLNGKDAVRQYALQAIEKDAGSY